MTSDMDQVTITKNETQAELIILDETGSDDEVYVQKQSSGLNSEDEVCELSSSENEKFQVVDQCDEDEDEGDNNREDAAEEDVIIERVVVNDIKQNEIILNTCCCQNCEYKTKVETLQNEVAALRVQLKNSTEGSTISSNNSDVPVVNIQFANEELARKFKSETESFLHKVFKKVKKVNTESSQNDSNLQSETSIKSFSEFFIDNMGGSKRVKKESSWKVPSYSQEFENVLETSDVSEKKSTETPRRPKVPSCYNCQGQHVIAECPKLSESEKKKISSSPRQNANRNNRYHLDCSEQFSKFKPGLISKNLREALGLEICQLPKYVYNMRLLGYPPGWLEEIKTQSSGINMYGSDSKDNKSSNLNEGVYDYTKLIDFPGFNVQPEEHITDDYWSMGYPPMLPCHEKSSFVEHLKLVNPVSTCMPENNKIVNNAPSSVPIEIDMEVEDNEESNLKPNEEVPVILTDQEIVPEPNSSSALPSRFLSPSSEDNVVLNMPKSLKRKRTDDLLDPSSHSGSPSLEDLESKKNELMQQLETAADELDDSSSQESTPKRSLIDCQVSLSVSKSVQLGTPVIVRNTTFSKLPDCSKFSDGISEHIPFENLPDSTGQYERLRTVLKSIKTKRM